MTPSLSVLLKHSVDWMRLFMIWSTTFVSPFQFFQRKTLIGQLEDREAQLAQFDKVYGISIMDCTFNLTKCMGLQSWTSPLMNWFKYVFAVSDIKQMSGGK